MTIDEYKVFADACFRDTPPPCAAVCPLAFDVREFIRLMQRGSYRSAWRLYRNSVIFPAIVSKLCDGRCKSVCVREKRPDDCGVDLRALERTLCERMQGKAPERFALPKKEERVAVVGADFAALSCAYRLASFGYPVTVYTQGRTPGEGLDARLDDAWSREEVLREFSAVNCTFVTEKNEKTAEEMDADAVFVSERGVTETNGSPSRLFYNKKAEEGEVTEAIACGLRYASAVEVYFKTGKMESVAPTVEYAADKRYYALAYKETAIPIDAKGEEEAFRCMRCNCTACRDVCPLMEKGKLFPKKMCAEIILTLKPNMSKRTGVRMIMGCTSCGRCRDVCPEHIDMGYCLDRARIDFFESGAMSPAFHDYWLQDMTHAMSDEAFLSRRQDDTTDSDVLFFPGCQLGAYLPRAVRRTFDALCEIHGNAAVLLGCCGVPARWAGDCRLADAVKEKLCTEWVRMGRPEIVTACPSCLRHLKESLPEAEVTSLYTHLAQRSDQFPEKKKEEKGIVSVADPCASGAERKMQDAVRVLLERAGYTVRNKAPDVGCCGFGGHIYPSAGTLGDSFATRRTGTFQGTVVTYCANCADVFSAKGADAYHILTMLYDNGEKEVRPASLDLRRENRHRLKCTFTGEPVTTQPQPIDIEIPASMIDRLNRALVRCEQVTETISHAEENGNVISDDEGFRFYAHRRFRTITLWVVYTKENHTITAEDFYIHRVEVRESL